MVITAPQSRRTLKLKFIMNVPQAMADGVAHNILAQSH
jgi:hypothetical protein